MPFTNTLSYSCASLLLHALLATFRTLKRTHFFSDLFNQNNLNLNNSSRVTIPAIGGRTTACETSIKMYNAINLA